MSKEIIAVLTPSIRVFRNWTMAHAKPNTQYVHIFNNEQLYGRFFTGKELLHRWDELKEIDEILTHLQLRTKSDKGGVKE